MGQFSWIYSDTNTQLIDDRVKDFYYGSEWKWTGTEPFKNVADKVEHIGKGYYKIKEN